MDEGTSLSDPLLQAKIAKSCNTAIVGNYGLTIGFWKTHTSNWEVYTPDTTLGSVFPALNDSYYQPGQDESLLESLANVTLADACPSTAGPASSTRRN